MADEDDISQFEAPPESDANKEAAAKEQAAKNQVRRTIANTYTFVRSREINKTISSFTLDHYIDEAKRKIKEPGIVRSASDPGKGVGTRPSQLDQLSKLEEAFNKSMEEAGRLADKVSAASEESGP